MKLLISYLHFPEIIFAVLISLVLLINLRLRNQDQARWSYWCSQLSLFIVLALTWQQKQLLNSVNWDNFFIFNPAIRTLQLFIIISAIFALAYSKNFFSAFPKLAYDYCLLFLFSILGMLTLVSSNHLLSLFLSIELISLPQFALIALQQKGESAEAALKYFALSVFATALMLYGFSFVYGLTGNLNLSSISEALHFTSVNNLLMLITAIIFILVALAFKLNAAPFHFWAPDVYQAAPAPIIALISSAPKIAILVIIIRLCNQTFPEFFHHWQAIWQAISIISITLGNIAAIAQYVIRRMLAYSAIAHMGYVLLGLICGTSLGNSAALMYMLSYALMTLAAFGALIVISNQGFAISLLDDLRGLNTRNPWIAFMILIIMFSMAGIPPTLGFFAKLNILQALISSHLIGLAAYSLIFSIIGAFYYIRVVKIMYFETPTDNAPLLTSLHSKCVLSLNTLIILILGILPSYLISLCQGVYG